MSEDNSGVSHRKMWYVVNDPASREYNGPYSVSEIVQMVEDGRLKMEGSWAFKKDDTSMVTINSIPGVERRSVRTKIDLPLPKVTSKVKDESWWYYTDRTDVVGPLSLIELRRDVACGKVTRETPVWKNGMKCWVYLFQVDDFDRRESDKNAS